MKKLKKIEKLLIFILLILSIGLGTGMGIFVSSFINTDEIVELENFKPEIPSKIYDRNGVLISELFTVKREPVTFEQIPKDLINAILAIEDISFYTHKGIHIKRVIGALIANIKTGNRAQGASTITMQLARTLFTGREKTWARKVKESWLALKIEKKYSKNEILTLYCNQIYFGHGAYGIEAASQFYFNKHIQDLTLAESALLAGLPQSPNRLSPLKNPHLARKRQELVLESMVDIGMVNPKNAYDSFQDFWINFRLQMRSPSQSVHKLAENRAPHFVEYVRQRLESLYGSDRIYTDGLKVYTSLDLTQQALADRYLHEGLERQNEIYKITTDRVKDTLDSRILDSLDMISLIFDLDSITIGEHKSEERIVSYLNEHIIAPLDMLSFLFNSDSINRIIETSYTTDLRAGEFQKVEGAIIAIEPKNGYITAMVGGSSFSEDNQINRATQIRRQTGSGFKPYIYTTAIDTKIFTTSSIITDSPVVFFDGDREWIPDNYSGTYQGKMRLREGLRRSVNVVTAKVVDRLGVDTVVKYAANLLGIEDQDDITNRIPKVYSIALGVVELSPYEMAKGFATFANHGKEVKPISILYVLDRDGNLIDNFEEKLRKEEVKKGQRQVISEQTNFIMLDMLRDVLRPGGTGYRAATANGFDRPAAGKTGTTQNWKDAWFTGFTPDLVSSVWVGFDRNSISLGRGQAGGVVAAPIWAKFMRDALQDKPATWYSRPRGVYAIKICRNSGLLPTKECKDTMVEYFLEGTIPKEYCYDCGREKQDKSFNIDIFKNRKRGSDSDTERDFLKDTENSGFGDTDIGEEGGRYDDSGLYQPSTDESIPSVVDEYDTVTETEVPLFESEEKPQGTENMSFDSSPAQDSDDESNDGSYDSSFDENEDTPFLVIE